MSRDELVSGLVRIGELEITGEDRAAVDAYFAPNFKFHGPDGRELDYQGLQAYFAALRAAFDAGHRDRGRQLRGLPDDDRGDVRPRVHPLSALCRQTGSG